MFGTDRDHKSIMPSKFVRSSPHRATVGTLKQPRLPGSERFRFNRSTENISAPDAATDRHLTTTPTANSSASSCRRPTSPPPPVPTSSTRSLNYGCGRRSLDSAFRQLTTTSTTAAKSGPPFQQPVYYFRQGGSAATEGRRKPIIPISKHTSRVLNNTNVELSADAIEFIKNETSRINDICKTYIVPTPITTSAANVASAESDVDGSDSGASSLSSASSARSSGCSDRTGRFWIPGSAAATSSSDSVETVAVRGGHFPVNGRPAAPILSTFRPRSTAARVDVVDDVSTASTSSLVSNDSDDRSWMRIRRMRSGGSSGSPSPTQSVCSSDSDNNPWILRSDLV